MVKEGERNHTPRSEASNACIWEHNYLDLICSLYTESELTVFRKILEVYRNHQLMQYIVLHSKHNLPIFARHPIPNLGY